MVLPNLFLFQAAENQKPERGKNLNSYKDIWNIVFDELSKKYTDAVMELWFNNFELVYLDDEKGFITTTSDGFVDLLNKKYGLKLKRYSTIL